MKKSLLLSAAMLAMASMAQAENHFYFFTENDGDQKVDVMGEVHGISENGKYAAIYDEEMELSYLWDSSNPTELKLINRTVGGKRQGFTAYSVMNDGTVVGSERPSGTTQWRPCTWKDGEFSMLPLPAQALNSNFAVAVTGDGKIIGGYIFTKNDKVETRKKAYPCVWELNDEGDYVITVYDDMELPDMQGFFVNCMYTDGTSEGTVLGGALNAGNGSFVPALCVGGELKVWNTFGKCIEDFYYKGELQGQYEHDTIDGVWDGWSDSTWAEGMFVSADYDGNFYGIRCFGNQPVPEDHCGSYSHKPGFYSLKTDSWTDVEPRNGISGISAGIEGRILFVNGGKEIGVADLASGTPEAPGSFFEVDTQGKPINSIDRIDKAGRVFGGSYAEIMEMTGEPRYYPFIIQLEEGLAGVQSIFADTDAKIGIVVAGGRIMVSGAQSVGVYDLDGRCVSTAADTAVQPGIYVVKADKVSRKVLVK